MGCKKRLLSSIEAFAKTLAIHRKSVERALERATEAIAVSAELQADLERLTVGEEPGDGSVDTTDHDGDIDAEADVPDDPQRPDPSELDLAELMTAADSGIDRQPMHRNNGRR